MVLVVRESTDAEIDYGTVVRGVVKQIGFGSPLGVTCVSIHLQTLRCVFRRL